MKLNLKSKILLGAIMMGGMAAGANTISNLPNPNDEKYDWTGTPEAPDNPGQPLLDRTIEEAQSFYDCDGEGDICATGTPVSGVGPNVTIHLE